MAQRVCDLTARFCDRYGGRRNRMHDRMVQAVRRGVQNIAEGLRATLEQVEEILTDLQARAAKLGAAD